MKASIRSLAVCLAFICVVALARAAAPSAGSAEPFRDGDVVCFVGDSITHTGSFPSLIALFYATRFPERRLTFESAGISGDRAVAIMADEPFRLKRDILGRHATVTAIMLGMNDIERGNYGLDKTAPKFEEARTHALVRYEQAMMQLVARLQEQGSRLILFTPTPYDDTAIEPVETAKFMSSGRQNAVGANAALARCADIVRDLARSCSAGWVDLHAAMTAINLREQARDPRFTVISADRIHPGVVGHFIMAYTFLKAQGLVRDVARIVVNAASGATTGSRDCELRKVEVTPQEIRFTVETRSLPFPISDGVRPALALVPFTEEFNREILQVTDLSSGNYRLAIDGVVLGNYTHDELARGTDLAAHDSAPQVVQATEAGRLAAEYMQVVMKQRDATSIFYTASKAGIDVTNRAALLAYAEKRKAELATSGKSPDLRFQRFCEALAEPGKFEQEATTLHAALVRACRPREHHVTLSRL